MTSQRTQIDLIINSFNGSSSEFSDSLEIVEFFKNKRYKLSTVIDINQELNFDKEKKITKNIRMSFHSMGKIFKINAQFPTPQVIFNKELPMTFLQFKLLSENHPSIFYSLLQGKHCSHLRFIGNTLVYPNDTVSEKENICIYCYSNKKINPLVTIFTDFRNDSNELNNEIISFCEENEITLKLIDLDNLFKYDLSQFPTEIQKAATIKKSSFFIYEKETEMFRLDNFFEILERKKNNKNKEGKCIKCGKSISISSGINICIDCCLSKSDSSLSISVNSGQSYKRGKRNPYNFIEKLKLKKIEDFMYADINAEDYLNEPETTNSKEDTSNNFEMSPNMSFN